MFLLFSMLPPIEQGFSAYVNWGTGKSTVYQIVELLVSKLLIHKTLALLSKTINTSFVMNMLFLDNF